MNTPTTKHKSRRKTTRWAMTKHDLAAVYFPGLKPASAQRKLERWINGNPHLLKMLKKKNYKNSQKKLTRSQLRIIFSVFGEP